MEHANVSLSDLIVKVLWLSLSKDDAIWVSTAWDNLTLTSEQEAYASLNVFAISLIYDAFSQLPIGRPVTDATVGGTVVKLLSCNKSSMVAYGVIAPGWPAKFSGVNITKTRTVVNITWVLASGYLICAELSSSWEEVLLFSFGEAFPFQLLCCIWDLQVCASNDIEEAHSVRNSMSNSPCSISSPLLQIHIHLMVIPLSMKIHLIMWWCMWKVVQTMKKTMTPRLRSLLMKQNKTRNEKQPFLWKHSYLFLAMKKSTPMFLVISGISWICSKFQYITDFDEHLHGLFGMHCSSIIGMTSLAWQNLLQREELLMSRRFYGTLTGHGNVLSATYLHLKFSYIEYQLSSRSMGHYWMQPLDNHWTMMLLGRWRDEY